ncbi:MAG: hypothetical protein JKY52_02210 [Flavobacteriales bacterium]|nr:hypothetical protein [Flavobacteriales bacterium]
MLVGLLDGPIHKIETLLVKLEGRFGLIGASLIVSGILMLIASVYCAPALTLINHGTDYSLLAANPFDLEAGNRFQNRILTPVIGFLFFLRGPAFIILPLLIASVFLATLYLHFRKLGVEAAIALGFCCFIAFSSPILFTLHFAGYVDTTSYLLLFLCYAFRKHPLWVFVCYALALLNHESNAFALPWIIIMSGYRNGITTSGLMKSIAAAVLAFLPLLLVRYLFSESASHLQFGWYFNRGNIADSIWLQRTLLFDGIFQAFKLFWVLPIVATLLALKKKQYYTAIIITTIVASAGMQLFIAADTSRLIGLAFPAIIIGAVEIWRNSDHTQFRRLCWGLIVINFLIHQAFVGYGIIIPFHSLPMAIFMKYYLGVDVWTTDWI